MSDKTVSVDFKSVPQGRLGMWILIAGELVIFGGLISCYVLYRMRFPQWAEQAHHTSTFFGALNTFVLLTSSFFVVKAHDASLKRELAKVTMWMSATILCGLIFLVNKSIEYYHEMSEGFTMSSPAIQHSDPVGATFWSFYYTMTGLHATHVLVGMTALFFIMLDARKGKNLHRVELGGMYWHMVDLVWIFLFPLLYIAK